MTWHSILSQAYYDAKYEYAKQKLNRIASYINKVEYQEWLLKYPPVDMMYSGQISIVIP